MNSIQVFDGDVTICWYCDVPFLRAHAPVHIRNHLGHNRTPAAQGRCTLRIKGGGALTEHADYEILGYYNNVKRGNAFIFVKGLGSYSGSRVISFKIGPAAIAVP